MLTSKSSAEVYSSVDKHRLVLCIKSDQYLMISSGYQHLLAVVFDSDCFAYLALRVAEFIQHNMTENNIVHALITASVCDSSPCANGGLCSVTWTGAWSCSCQPGYSGNDCSCK